MGGSSFEQLVQEVLKQQQLMDQLETENRDLRRQLADLRAGRGLFINIGGRRFALAAEAPSLKVESSPHRVVPAPAPQPMVPQPQKAVDLTGVGMTTTEIAEAPTTAMPQLAEVPAAMVPAVIVAEVVAEQASGTPSKPLPVPVIEMFEEDERKTPTTTFLEDAMIDEFAAASTTPLSVWKAPERKKEIDEEEKAALRRELMGSFLLE